MSEQGYRQISNRVILQDELKKGEVPDRWAKPGVLLWNGDNLRFESQNRLLDMGRVTRIAKVKLEFSLVSFLTHAGLISALFIVAVIFAVKPTAWLDVVASAVAGLIAGTLFAGVLELQRLIGTVWVRVEYAALVGKTGVAFLCDQKGSITGGNRWLFNVLSKVLAGDVHFQWRDWNWLGDSIIELVLGGVFLILGIVVLAKNVYSDYLILRIVLGVIMGLVGLALLAAMIYSISHRLRRM